MVFSIHDFTDSEDEEEEASGSATQLVNPAIRDPTTQPATQPSHPLRITLRPSLNHLVNPSQGGQPSRHPRSSDRDSLSPPPPITLRLGMKQPTSAPVSTRRTSYSSSESSSNEAERRPNETPLAEHPHKKPRLTSHSPTKRLHPPTVPSGESSNTTSAKKSYDWLAPSAAGASHHGPHPERAVKVRVPIISGWSPDVPEDNYDPIPTVDVAKRSHKKIVDPTGQGSGPGKAWRKGLRKGMAIPWKEGSTFQADGTIAGPSGSRNDTGSAEGTPEPRRMSTAPQGFDRPPNGGFDDFSGPQSPNFVPADPAELGFPVFSKPIIPPVIHLSTFPKVTTAFGPPNGGDTGPFPRREKVRNWKFNEKTYVGIGGGSLKFRTWHRGASSELGRLLAADKEAKELIPKKPRPSAVQASPSLGANDLIWEAAMGGRPDLKHSKSSDSLLATGGLDDREGSDMGDGEDSVLGLASSGTVTPKPKATKSGAKTKGRKSKLANEIIPISETSSVTTEQTVL